MACKWTDGSDSSNSTLFPHPFFNFMSREKQNKCPKRYVSFLGCGILPERARGGVRRQDVPGGPGGGQVESTRRGGPEGSQKAGGQGQNTSHKVI